MWVRIPDADGGINVESQQRVLKDVWLGEKATDSIQYTG